MPSSTLVTHAGKSLLTPFTSTRQRRQAPTADRPSKRHMVGMNMPSSCAASRIVSVSRALTSRPSMTSVFTRTCVVIAAPPALPVAPRTGTDQLYRLRLELALTCRANVIGNVRQKLILEIADHTERGIGR